jgi:hypothetical protein
VQGVWRNFADPVVLRAARPRRSRRESASTYAAFNVNRGLMRVNRRQVLGGGWLRWRMVSASRRGCGCGGSARRPVSPRKSCQRGLGSGSAPSPIWSGAVLRLADEIASISLDVAARGKAAGIEDHGVGQLPAVRATARRARDEMNERRSPPAALRTARPEISKLVSASSISVTSWPA